MWLPRGMEKGQVPREAVPGAKAGRNAPTTAGLSGGWRGFALDQVRGPSHTELMRSVVHSRPRTCSRRGSGYLALASKYMGDMSYISPCANSNDSCHLVQCNAYRSSAD